MNWSLWAVIPTQAFSSSRRQRPPYHRSGHGAKLASPTNRTLTSRNFLTGKKCKKPSIAKALAQESDVILLDEPTAFLDLPSRIETMSLLHRLAEESGKTILMSTHDVEQALVLADRLWLLSPGSGLECGVTEDMILAGRLDKLFPSVISLIRYRTRQLLSTRTQPHSHHSFAADPTLLHWGINLRIAMDFPVSSMKTFQHLPKTDIPAKTERYLIFPSMRQIASLSRTTERLAHSPLFPHWPIQSKE